MELGSKIGINKCFHDSTAWPILFH
jgi:hypothetical protein